MSYYGDVWLTSHPEVSLSIYMYIAIEKRIRESCCTYLPGHSCPTMSSWSSFIVLLARPFYVFCFFLIVFHSQVDIHYVDKEGQSDDYVDEAEEEEEEEESPLSQRRSSATQHRQQQQQEKPEATTDGDVSRSMPETRRSELALQLGNGVRHNRGMVRARSAIPASCTTSSMSMIASLISLEAFRTSKEKQQQQQQTKSAFAANVPAQVHYFCSVTSANTVLFPIIVTFVIGDDGPLHISTLVII